MRGCSYCLQEQHIDFFQRILIVLRLAHFLILFPAEIGIGRGQLGEKLKQAVRIDKVIVRRPGCLSLQ